MWAYLLRRLLLMLPTLLGITLVVFCAMALSPGGITAQTLIEGQNMEPQAKKALEDYYNRIYGLDQPAPVQYLRWLNNISPVGFTLDEQGSIDGFSLAKTPDLGTSFNYGRPVAELITERVPITLLLNALTIPLVYLIAIAIGVRAATDRGGRFDRGSSIGLLALWSAPTMLVGVLLLGFFANTQYFHWFPTAGLSEREALDMPFLPHWASAGDGLIVFACLIAGLLVALAIARVGVSPLRLGLALALGGLLVAAGLAGSGFSVSNLLIGLAVLGTLALLARSDSAGLRLFGIGLAGLVAGGLVAGQFVGSGMERGFLLDRLWHLALPVICLTYGGFAFLAKLSRAAVLENLQADYARTARAKGVPEKQVLWRHVFRNSLLPLITVLASLLPSLLAGSVIVESIFSIDGMGRLVVEAVRARDRELVMSLTLISGLLTLVGYLLADIGYALADPRVSYD